MRLLLASTSASRRAMLTAAGVPHEVASPGVDEEAAKVGLRQEGLSPRDFCDALAEFKARKLSQRHADRLVLGGDSILVLPDGTVFDKPASLEEARAHLHSMSGQRVELLAAAVIAEGGVPVWRHVDRALLWVRPLGEAFLDAYLAQEWPAIAGCAGCFRIEGPGVQLFSKVEGSQFTILGMPLLPILDYLRVRGVLPA